MKTRKRGFYADELPSSRAEAGATKRHGSTSSLDRPDPSVLFGTLDPSQTQCDRVHVAGATGRAVRRRRRLKKTDARMGEVLCQRRRGRLLERSRVRERRYCVADANDVDGDGLMQCRY